LKAKLKQYYPVIFLTIVVFVSITLLTITNSITKDKVEEQKDGSIFNTLEGMFPDMSEFKLIDEVYVIYDDGNVIGYAYLAAGKGYGGSIEILVGLEDETTIKGISIINHSESPGLGSRITEDEYLTQYNKLKISDSDLKSSGGKIDAITGATISSKAVADAVRTTALEKVREIFQKGGIQDE
jgi:Na+-translocating ferredoxin:NAD+ oxidoreductase subunit G